MEKPGIPSRFSSGRKGGIIFEISLSYLFVSEDRCLKAITGP
jgi:hypothetical protein